MARARWISPDDHVDDRYLDGAGRVVSRDARQVLLAIKHVADRAGRLEDRPLTIKARFFPWDTDLDVDACLAALAALPDAPIVRYEAEGRRFVQITWAWERIHPDKTEKASRLPAPPGFVATPESPESHPGIAREDSRATPGQAQGDTGASPGATPESPGSAPGVAEGSMETETESGVTAVVAVPSGASPGATPESPGSAPGVAEGSMETETESGVTAVVAVPSVGQSKHHSPEQQRARAREADPPPPQIPRCTSALPRGTCDHELVRERGIYRSEGTGGRGWLCNPRDGGCGKVYPRDAPEVTRQLSENALTALEREVGAETAGRKEIAAERADVARLVEEFVYGEGAGLRAEVQDATKAFGLWDEIAKKIAAAVNPHTYATWFRPIAGARLAGKKLVVAVPNAHFAEQIPKAYRDVIASATKELTRDGITVAFRTESELLLERYDAWSTSKGLAAALRQEVRVAVCRQLGEPAA